MLSESETTPEAVEVWKSIPGFDGYEVSDRGRVRSLPRTRVDHGGRNGGRRQRHVPGVMLRPALSRGYWQVSLTRNAKGYTRYVHRLVLEAFVGPRPEGMECRHLNGIRTDSRLVNLAWGTTAENQADREEHGTANIGEQHPAAKLSEWDVVVIRARAGRGERHKHIADDFGISRGCVGLVCKERWLHVPTFSCSYSPEDDKLRITASDRFSDDIKERIKAAGFRWAGAQGIWVCYWSVDAEDLCLAIAPDIGDEDYSPAERSADRAERFSGYRDKRRSEAGQLADRYDSGPSVVGNQNMARAERIAGRHDRVRRNALSQWSKAEYWQSRTQGVIDHALYRLKPGVRRARLIRLESELRKLESRRDSSIAFWNKWKQIAAMDDLDEQTKVAAAYSGRNGGSYWDCTHPDGEQFGEHSLHRLMVPVTDEDDKPKWRAITGAEAAAIALSKFPEKGPGAEGSVTDRWVKHFQHRIAYEKAMIDAEGGMARDVDMIPGGFIGRHQILKVNKSPATRLVVSVAVWGPHPYRRDADGNPEFGPQTINIERLGETAYRPPSDAELATFQREQAERKKAAAKSKPKAPTLVNPTVEDAERLQELLNAEGKDKARDGVNYVGSEVLLLTQAKYSALSKGAYAKTETRTLHACGRLSRMASNLWTAEGKAYDDSLGEAVCKLRTCSAGGASWTAPRRIVVLTDKPQKPIQLDWSTLESVSAKAEGVAAE